MNKILVLILCNNYSENIKQFEKLLTTNNIQYKIICDSCTHDQDKILLDNGFYNLTRSPYIKKPSAWDKSFYTIYKDSLTDNYDYFFFIEDDIYSVNYTKLVNFIIETINYSTDFITKCIRPKDHNPEWRHWKEDYVDKLKIPSQSFNPICRLSSKLIKNILSYRKNNNRFNFHEILFASLCLENNLTYTNYIEDSVLKIYFGNIVYLPILTIQDLTNDLIYHPVKETKDAREKGIVSLDNGR